MDTRRLLIIILFLVIVVRTVDAQVAVKTNVFYDATATVNVGAEWVISPRWTMDLSGNINAWSTGGTKKWKHWMLQPEARYWFCDPFAGHFVGAHLHGGQYNFGGFDGKYHLFGTDAGKLKGSRYQGWFAGAGVVYGYAWILGRHWNLEAEVGIGYSYTRYDRFRCVGCGKKVENDKPHHYVGSTKAAVNLVYVF